MEAPHRGDGADLDEVWSSPGGLVCVSRDLTMSLLVFSNSSSSIGADCSSSGSSQNGSLPSGGLSSRSGGGVVLSPPSGVVETVGVAPEGVQRISYGLSTEVVEIIFQSRAPSTRKLSLKWIVHFMVCKSSTASS